MPKKRKSGGKTGSSGGRQGSIHCNKCGRLVPRGKAKRVTHYVTLTDFAIGKELREAGAIVPRRQVTEWYCVSCAVHTHKVNIRPGDDRRKHTKIR